MRNAMFTLRINNCGKLAPSELRVQSRKTGREGGGFACEILAKESDLSDFRCILMTVEINRQNPYTKAWKNFPLSL